MLDFHNQLKKNFQPLCSAVTQGYEVVANIVENVTFQAKEFIGGFFS